MPQIARLEMICLFKLAKWGLVGKLLAAFRAYIPLFSQYTHFLGRERTRQVKIHCERTWHEIDVTEYRFWLGDDEAGWDSAGTIRLSVDPTFHCTTPLYEHYMGILGSACCVRVHTGKKFRLE